MRYFFKFIRRLLLLKRNWSTKLRLAYYRSLYGSHFSAGNPFTAGRYFNIFYDASNAEVHMGNGVHFRDYCRIRCGTNGKLHIGDRVFFNNNCSLNCFNEIQIGNDCQFGENVQLYDMNHQYKDADKPISEQGYSTGNITIGNNCWIGSNVTILKNVTIGNHVVVGANCVVHKDIPDGCIAFSGTGMQIKKINP